MKFYGPMLTFGLDGVFKLTTSRELHWRCHGAIYGKSTARNCLFPDDFSVNKRYWLVQTILSFDTTAVNWFDMTQQTAVMPTKSPYSRQCFPMFSTIFLFMPGCLRSRYSQRTVKGVIRY